MLERIIQDLYPIELSCDLVKRTEKEQVTLNFNIRENKSTQKAAVVAKLQIIEANKYKNDLRAVIFVTSQYQMWRDCRNIQENFQRLKEKLKTNRKQKIQNKKKILELLSDHGAFMQSHCDVS